MDTVFSESAVIAIILFILRVLWAYILADNRT